MLLNVVISVLAVLVRLVGAAEAAGPLAGPSRCPRSGSTILLMRLTIVAGDIRTVVSGHVANAARSRTRVDDVMASTSFWMLSTFSFAVSRRSFTS